MAGQWHDTFLTDLDDVQGLNECKDLSGQGPRSGGQVSEDRLSTRRTIKADREKLRRDKLNEQFSELANALDPDRPKNDKATILGESLQIVKDLRDEVKRLKTEHSTLLEESADLTQEKNELREEKVSLKSETERLQSQMQQRFRASSPWMAMDPSLMLGAALPFPYPIPPQPVSLAPSDANQVGGSRAPLVSPTPYMPIPPPVGSFHMHPYAMFGNRLGDGGNPFMPFSGFPPPVTSQSHIERPYAQYPSSVQHPAPGYAVHLSPSQGSQSSSGSPSYRPCVPCIPVVPPQNDTLNTPSKGSNNHPPTLQSSPQHVPEEVEQHNGGRVAADNEGSPVSQEIKAAGTEDCLVKGPNVEAHGEENKDKMQLSPRPSTACTAKEKLGFFLEKGTLSMITEGQAHDLAGMLDMENDSTLRPPAA